MSASMRLTPEILYGVTETAASSAGAAAARGIDLFYPMSEFYDRRGAPAPTLLRLERIDAGRRRRALRPAKRALERWRNTFGQCAGDFTARHRRCRLSADGKAMADTGVVSQPDACRLL